MARDDVGARLALNGVACGARLHPVSVSCAPGRLVHVVGPNGAGKSTLLARSAGLLAGDGRVELDGRPLTDSSARELALHRAYLAQQQRPTALMPVFQYLSLHRPATASAAAMDEAVAFLADHLTLRDKLARPLTQLSGGEWQRVRLAAVLLQIWPSLNPFGRLLVLDEPAAGLDVAQQAALDAVLKRLCRAGIAVLASGHDLNHSLHHADDVWLLCAGKLVAAGRAAWVMQPARLTSVFGIAFQRQQVGERDWIVARHDDLPDGDVQR